MKRLSMRVRMASVFATLIAAVALFMIQFFPAQMAEQAQISTELRARTVTRVMATAVAPALEFDDADYAAKILGWLASTPDARFAVVVTDNGKRFAAWSADRIPATLPSAASAISGNLLVTSAPVDGRVGGGGTLYIGQSLDQLVRDRAAARGTVVTASLIVLAIALLACLVIATTLVRPLERLTAIAHDIARGTKPPRIEAVKGGREVVQMTNALGTMLDRLNAANSQLVEASRHAGMAEVATGVLHNVGNVLTSVNVGIETLGERVGTIPADRIERAGELLRKVCDAPQVDREKVQAGVKYLAAISSHLVLERTRCSPTSPRCGTMSATSVA
jgi:methyl-accepting chemotaxis protein